MDDSENYARYQPNALGVSNQQGYSSSIRLKIPARSGTVNPSASNQSADNEEDGVEDEEMGDEGEERSDVRMIGKDSYDDDDDEEEEEEEDEDEDVDVDDVSGDDDDEDDEDGGAGGKKYNGKVGSIGIERPQKKRKLKNLISNYEFAPRARPPSSHLGEQSQPSSAGQDSWSDRETFALLDAWGERFLQQGRKSLRSGEWQEVAEKVSQVTDVERTDVQCRSRLDSLKKKYRKEKAKPATGGGSVSNWVFFKRMDMLLSSSQRPGSLSCGIDSGEYVFMNPNVYLNRANGLDEMRDSPGNSESSKDDEDEEDRVESKVKRNKAKRVGGASFQLLADSIQKFSDIYENVETSRRKQMVELENMRMDIQRQIEMQRRQILERAQAEIVRIRQGSGGGAAAARGGGENDLSAGNMSG